MTLFNVLAGAYLFVAGGFFWFCFNFIHKELILSYRSGMRMTWDLFICFALAFFWLPICIFGMIASTIAEGNPMEFFK